MSGEAQINDDINHNKDIHAVQYIQPHPFNQVQCRGVVAKAAFNILNGQESRLERRGQDTLTTAPSCSSGTPILNDHRKSTNNATRHTIASMPFHHTMM